MTPHPALKVYTYSLVVAMAIVKTARWAGKHEILCSATERTGYGLTMDSKRFAISRTRALSAGSTRGEMGADKAIPPQSREYHQIV